LPCTSQHAFLKFVNLIEDDPAYFALFFDTTPRRICYIAPERFVSSLSEPLLLNQKMDIFSLGCVLAELFLDGKPLFTLSSLLAYKTNLFDPFAELKAIENEAIRVHFIQLQVFDFQYDSLKPLGKEICQRIADGILSNSVSSILFVIYV
jgi:serine/threonine protein kinase